MFRGLRPPSSALGLGLSLLVVLGPGCSPDAPLARSGVVLEPPTGWRPVKAETWPVPGEPLAAWSGPGGASMVVYRALPIPGGTAKSVAEELANRLTNLPGLRVERKESASTVGGWPVARVEAVAPGTGDALAPTGTGTPIAPRGRALIPTRRVTFGIVRPSDTIYLTWHAPESAARTLDTPIEEALRGLRLGPNRQTTSSY